MEQGLGIGSGKPFFNRHTASMTRFLKLRDPPASSSALPTILVLHARAGNAFGDMASYDYFTLGGPFSVGPLSSLHFARTTPFPAAFYLTLLAW